MISGENFSSSRDVVRGGVEARENRARRSPRLDLGMKQVWSRGVRHPGHGQRPLWHNGNLGGLLCNLRDPSAAFCRCAAC